MDFYLGESSHAFDQLILADSDSDVAASWRLKGFCKFDSLSGRLEVPDLLCQANGLSLGLWR